MASIKTVLGIQDNMTRPLKHITSAMGILINTMENMERMKPGTILPKPPPLLIRLKMKSIRLDRNRNA